MAETKLVGVDVGGTFTDLVVVDEATGDCARGQGADHAARTRPAGVLAALAAPPAASRPSSR